MPAAPQRQPVQESHIPAAFEARSFRSPSRFHIHIDFFRGTGFFQLEFRRQGILQLL